MERIRHGPRDGLVSPGGHSSSPDRTLHPVGSAHQFAEGFHQRNVFVHTTFLQAALLTFSFTTVL